MKQDEIIEMARQAGFSGSVAKMWIEPFEAFAKLVEERTAAKEREACAKVCEETISNAQDSWDRGVNTACVNLAKAIRARGEA